MKPGRTERKNRRLSSQNRKRSGRKKAEKEGERPKAKAEGKHLWNSCGSEAGKDERKQTGSRVRRTGKESMGNQAGKNGERPEKRERKGRTGEATVRRKREERGKEETEAE